MRTLNWVLITPHQGLGDHILCTGIYREYSRTFKRVFVSVRKNYKKELIAILGDQPNITLITLPNSHLWRNTIALQRLARFFGIQVMGLGGYGENFLQSGIRYDQDFYRQARVDFKNRWTSFSHDRNLIKEDALFEELGCSLGPYIFLHEDRSREFLINPSLLEANFRIIQPTANREIYNLVDYRKVIEGAEALHVIESSFAAFAESLSLPMPKFAHRYARPEAQHDPRMEFTYRNNWRILFSSP
jgi:hypothetical protein